MIIKNQDYKIEKAAPEDAEAGPKVSEEGKTLGEAGMNREYITEQLIVSKSVLKWTIFTYKRLYKMLNIY